MERILVTSLGTVSYRLRKSARAKHIRISVACDGAVVVTQPTAVSFERVEYVVTKKIDWILKKVSFFQSRGLTRITPSRGEYARRKEEARLFIQSRIESFNAYYGFRIGKICIRSQKTRWGSCSKKGNLNFNYRIVHLTPELIDYIVAHELCHLAELNHSKNFWQLLGRTIPNYRILKKRLRTVAIS